MGEWRRPVFLSATVRSMTRAPTSRDSSLSDERLLSSSLVMPLGEVATRPAREEDLERLTFAQTAPFPLIAWWVRTDLLDG